MFSNNGLSKHESFITNFLCGWIFWKHQKRRQIDLVYIGGGTRATEDGISSKVETYLCKSIFTRCISLPVNRLMVISL